MTAKQSPSQRQRRSRMVKIWDLTKGYCVYCNRFTPYAYRSVDHVVPRSMGGTYRLDNLVPACKKCNGFRANKTPASAYAHPHWQPLVRGRETQPSRLAEAVSEPRTDA